ncbi:MAG: winged helix-turn-helix domain-containing protein [Desulfobacula sp.]|nr:winged helix-turn-helix domain-containing protein [Desulfobacula sp.]
MTIKEAILQSLEDLKRIANYMEVHDYIIKNNYYDFKDAKTPASTISALLGDFIRLGDSRVKRIKGKGGTFSYYLTKFEKEIDIDNVVIPSTETKPRKKEKTYQERD